MAGPQAAWADALGGQMSFGKDRSKYYSLPAPSDPSNGFLSFINQLANESLLMPQTATAGWVNAFGPPPGTSRFATPQPAAGPAIAPMPSGAGVPASSGLNTVRRPNVVPMGPRAPTGMSIPMQQQPDYWTLVNGLEGTGKNPKSSAMGPGQFIDSTFDEYLKSTGKALGQGGVPADRAAAKQSLGQDATMWYKSMNEKALAKAGIPVDNTTLYGAHFLGPGGLQKIWQADPTTPVAQLLDSGAIEANPTILAGKTAGEVKAWLAQKTAGNALPTPPTMGAPPQVAGPKNLDFSQANSFLDAAKPKGVDQEAYNADNLSAVLGGLAGGASQVDVTKPGAVAAVLAAMGAGGQAGMQSSGRARLAAGERADAASQSYNLTRASNATQQMTAQHAVEDQQNQVAFQNAKMVWDTTNANKATQYEGAMKERAARAPKITSDANGFMVQQYNPATQSMDVKYTPTKDIFAQAEKSSELIKTLGAPGPASEAMLAQHLMTTIKDPVIAQAVLEKEAIRRTLASGGGATVFGKAYEAAMKAAETGLPTTLLKDPEAYMKAQQDAAASALYNAIAKKGDRSWLKAAAANGSIIAGILNSGGTE